MGIADFFKFRGNSYMNNLRMPNLIQNISTAREELSGTAAVHGAEMNSRWSLCSRNLFAWNCTHFPLN
jgi:hypothetical protein